MKRQCAITVAGILYLDGLVIGDDHRRRGDLDVVCVMRNDGDDEPFTRSSMLTSSSSLAAVRRPTTGTSAESTSVAT